eukprot:TRINITY_DN11374_c0_g1_i1.p1 TRINITY_DN11374_c0_g1~~TRINITY_DN11374_c0_g1_i1.p1  ORF type:complete len:496 (-),score=82.44 TRINITY_DN11374_c0_g1_i1:277-1716(-)
MMSTPIITAARGVSRVTTLSSYIPHRVIRSSRPCLILNKKWFQPGFPVHLGPHFGWSLYGYQSDVSTSGKGAPTKPQDEPAPPPKWDPHQRLDAAYVGVPEKEGFRVFFHEVDSPGTDAPDPAARTSIRSDQIALGLTTARPAAHVAAPLETDASSADASGSPAPFRKIPSPTPPSGPLHLLSPWHSIPLTNGTFTDGAPFFYVNEIPRGTRAKMEIQTRVPFNPIGQDTKKGQLRFLEYSHPLCPDGMPFHYGAFPQTWENPRHCHFRGSKGARALSNGMPAAADGYGGDDDPIDVVNLSLTPRAVGEVVAVRIVGVLPMLDDGEADWKVLVVEADDMSMDHIRTSHDVPPETVEAVRHWFQYYKTVDGKPENVFAHEGEVLDGGIARAVVEHTHRAWDALRRGLEPWAAEGKNGTDTADVSATVSGESLSALSASLVARPKLTMQGIRPDVQALEDAASPFHPKKWWWSTGGEGWKP